MLLKADLRHMGTTGTIGKLHAEAQKVYLRYLYIQYNSLQFANSLNGQHSVNRRKIERSYRLTAQTR